MTNIWAVNFQREWSSTVALLHLLTALLSLFSALGSLTSARPKKKGCYLLHDNHHSDITTARLKVTDFHGNSLQEKKQTFILESMAVVMQLSYHKTKASLWSWELFSLQAQGTHLFKMKSYFTKAVSKLQINKCSMLLTCLQLCQWFEDQVEQDHQR